VGSSPTYATTAFSTCTRSHLFAEALNSNSVAGGKSVSLTTEQLVEAFALRSLPRDKWTHHAHLKVGLWYLLHYSPNESMERLRQDIKQYNVAWGIENTDTQGYHETITRFYVRLTDRFVRQTDRSRSIDALAKDLIERHGSRLLLSKHYSHDRLMSKAARYKWLEPDLMPLI